VDGWLVSVSEIQMGELTDLTWVMKGIMNSSVSLSSVSKPKSAMDPEVGEGGHYPNYPLST